jgi:hypothetical protein
MLSDAEKEARKIARAQRAAKAARQRLLESERAVAKEINSVRKHIPEDIRRALDYIASEIPRRESHEDVEFLRETRERHFRPFRKFLKPKEGPST